MPIPGRRNNSIIGSLLTNSSTWANGIFSLSTSQINLGANTYPINVLASSNVSSTSVYNFAQLIGTQSAATTPTLGGYLTLNGNNAGKFEFVRKSGSQTLSSFTSTDWYAANNDIISCIYVNGNMTINPGVVFTPTQRKALSILYVNGNLTINGQISMTKRGANHRGDGTSGQAITPFDIPVVGAYTIPGTGPSGAGSNGSTGRGANGYGANGGVGGAGQVGTCFGGGSAGGSATHSTTAGSAQTWGGAAGNMTSDGSGTSGMGGSAGNPGSGGAWGGSNGEDGTGGTLIVFVSGTLSGNGVFSANGGNGGSTNGAGNFWRQPGTGSGGGSINVFYNALGNSVSMTAPGGLDGGGAASGYAGSTRQIAIAFS